jgi:hypothetical protein
VTSDRTPRGPARNDPDDPLVRLPQRLGRKIEVAANGCWLWTGTKYPDGYGMVYVLGSGRDRRLYTRAHRVVYEALVGPIPEGLELDYVAERGCTSKACVNPAHLEPVTHLENVQRHYATRPPRTRCEKDHDLTQPNSTTDGRCRACRRAAAAERRIAS